MVQKFMEEKKHIFIGQNGKPAKYTYPRKVIIKSKVIPRDRASHGAQLSEQLQSAKLVEDNISAECKDIELDSPIGIQLSFESFPGIELSFEKLADVRNGIELLSVIEKDDKYIANVLVPQGKLGVLEKKVNEYLLKNNKSGPKHAPLINSISEISKTVIENLWTDHSELFPKSGEEIHWFEVWLPVLGDRLGVVADFKKLCGIHHITISDSTLEFPERTVLLIKSSIDIISQSALLLSKISEIRKSKTTAEFFNYLDTSDQRLWIDNLLEKTTFDSDKEPVYVSVLDTGVNIDHPLISPVASEEDLFVVEPNWDAADGNGHGTLMAGLAIWGDIAAALDSDGPIRINHKLESIKLLRHSGDNEGKNLGQVTADGISLSEIENFNRKRIYTLALSAKDSMDRGKPSAWSAELDALASDYMGENAYPRLFVVCAGNTGDQLTDLKEYPQYNELQDIHDPGQAWNVLTIGAYTTKTDITDDGGQNYQPLAPNGGLSPYSTTSVLWNRSMPLKPEIVFEGGNMGVDDISASSMSSLQLLSTYHDLQARLFATFNATSAATALAAKFAAEISSAYPSFWPETVRALMVHSAEWTNTMIDQFSYVGKTERQRAQHLLRVVGYGVPNIRKALWSVSNSLAIIVEDELQPFEKARGKDPSTKDMNIHDIPWPKESLLELGDTPVKMTVTLSYFVEPNPSSRNISSKYRYPSHQLRFDVKRPTESQKHFLQRLSRAARDEEEGTVTAPKDPDWLIGDFRNKGSIHKDIWTGTAADLAERGSVVVFPAMGWWRTRKKLERFNKIARYSLIISIETPSTEVDLYTAIKTKIGNKVSIDNKQTVIVSS
jgi:hypothetical protein